MLIHALMHPKYCINVLLTATYAIHRIPSTPLNFYPHFSACWSLLLHTISCVSLGVYFTIFYHRLLISSLESPSRVSFLCMLLTWKGIIAFIVIPTVSTSMATFLSMKTSVRSFLHLPSTKRSRPSHQPVYFPSRLLVMFHPPTLTSYTITIEANFPHTLPENSILPLNQDSPQFSLDSSASEPPHKGALYWAHHFCVAPITHSPNSSWDVFPIKN